MASTAPSVEARLADLFGWPAPDPVAELAADAVSAAGDPVPTAAAEAAPASSGPESPGLEPRPRRSRARGSGARWSRPPWAAGRWPGWRIDPGRRAAVAMLGVVIITAALVGARVVLTRPRTEVVAASASVTAPTGPGSVSAASVAAATVAPRTSSARAAAGSGPGPPPAVSGAPGAIVVVDVVGRVRRPGLVRLPGGARVDDAIRAAGGARPGTDLSAINLARICLDGEQIAIGVSGAAAPPGPGSTGAPAGASAALVNLNTATAEQLDTLPGVGPVMAQRIIEWRTIHGSFASIDQLRQVSGIGDVTYSEISPLVTV